MSSEITIITGHVGKDPDMRYTKDGKPVCNFSVAVNRRNGDVNWYRVSVWNKLAEVCHEYVYKGMLVQVQGSVSANAWIDQQGKPQASLDLLANSVQFLSRKDDGQAPQGADEDGSRWYGDGQGANGTPHNRGSRNTNQRSDSRQNEEPPASNPEHGIPF